MSTSLKRGGFDWAMPFHPLGIRSLDTKRTTSSAYLLFSEPLKKVVSIPMTVDRKTFFKLLAPKQVFETLDKVSPTLLYDALIEGCARYGSLELDTVLTYQKDRVFVYNQLSHQELRLFVMALRLSLQPVGVHLTPYDNHELFLTLDDNVSVIDGKLRIPQKTLDFVRNFK